MYLSAAFALWARVKLNTRQVIFTQNDQLLYGSTKVWPYVTRRIKRKGINRMMSKKSERQAEYLQTKEIIESKERQRKPRTTAHVLISGKFLCFPHIALYQLLPD